MVEERGSVMMREMLETEEQACDEIARLWVSGGGDIKTWDDSIPEILVLFDGDIEYRRGRIHMCDIVDTWQDDFGLISDDLIRLNEEIRGWIVSYTSAYGR